MRRLVAILFLASACAREPVTPGVSKEPISVRGWIADVAASRQAQIQNPQINAVRRLQLFQSTTVWVDDAPYVSGGVAENGSFLLLDVPPGNITITFTAPGAAAAKLVLKNIPGNADVFVPGLLLGSDSVTLLDPAKVTVRLAEKIDRLTSTGLTAQVAGLSIPVMRAPLAVLMDRHEYPNPPDSPAPIATVK